MTLRESRRISHTHTDNSTTARYKDHNPIEATMAAALRSALASRDPDRVASALDLPKLSSHTPTKKVHLRKHKEQLLESDQDWSTVVSCLMDAQEAAKHGMLEQCYEAQSSLHSSFNHLFATSSGNWLVPALHVVSRNTHRVAFACDEATKKDQSKMQNAVNLLQESFSRCLNDRSEYQVRKIRDVLAQSGSGITHRTVVL